MSFYVSPRFLDKVAVHITKNFLDLPGVKVPLILGIHGRKGEGKSFQCELVFERMGIEPVHMSAGELESPDAGDPARLIRLRYREAGEYIRTRGRMCVLMINDLDAGAGRFDGGTQYTVNTQLVNATLMNIADNPTNVQLPGSYDEKPLPRVPILVTGNDFSTLYAPLIRDGRMEKFYWDPDHEDRVGIVSGIFSDDGLSRQDFERLVDTFPAQSIDFFGALRSRFYDEQVRRFIQEVGVEQVSFRLLNSKEGAPTFQKPRFTLERLLEFGHLMVQEQERVRTSRLAEEYNRVLMDSRSPSEPSAPAAAPSVPVSRPPSYGGNSASSSPLTSEVVEQVHQLVRNGHRVGIEVVDERRFRTNSWNCCATLDTARPEEAITALESCIADHPSEYVRLVGIDPKGKKRVLETIVQRPKR